MSSDEVFFFQAKIKYIFIYFFFLGGLFANDVSEEKISDNEPENHLVNQWLPLGRKS
jgi:hypothetical protein